MNRWTYKLENILACWIFLFAIMGALLCFMVWVNIFEFSLLKALWYTFLYASGGSLISYIISVLFYPIIKEVDEWKKGWEKL